jgi:uncharacterized protein (DUF433 family)
MQLPDRIEIRRDVLGGKPCVRGTRIPVYLILQKLAAGESEATLVDLYPQLTSPDIRDCLAYAAGLATDEILLAG